MRCFTCTFCSVAMFSLLQQAVARGASDIHLQADTSPMLRLQGELQVFPEAAPLSNEAVLDFIAQIAPPRPLEELQADIVRGLDFAYDIPELSRFRCSVHRHLGRVGVVMRIVPRRVASLEELGMPPVVANIALCQRGLTLVTGTSGSGKSTTLAAMIGLLNESVKAKIITIEDPVEFIHPPGHSLITQLEVGHDTPSFEQALRQALRQDPDLILIGELRDVETLRMALRAADTGHQVFATLHSSNAAQAVERVIAMFPAAEHRLLLSQLAGSIEAIISQRLMPAKAGGRRAVVEVLRATSITRKYILEQRIPELRDAVETRESGMQSFDQHLIEMFDQKLVTEDAALRAASNPERLSMEMQGIRRTSGGLRPSWG